MNTGGRYNPTSNSWSSVTTSSAPAVRYWHTAVWIGSQMIVWGGSNGSIALGDGSHYNPASDSWSAATASNAPAARYLHTAVWTDSGMIVWGGCSGAAYLNDNYSYIPGRTLYLFQRP